MSISIEQLQKRVAAQFPDVQQISSSTIRFARKAGDSPFAVCYIDLIQDLPKTKKLLTAYQDQVIGTHYFEGNKSLQWNNYLYLLTTKDYLSNTEAYKAKILIENDRNYARKLVISEDELDSVLTPTQFIPVNITSKANILSIWTNSLIEAGIDKAIFSDDSLPDRLKLIEESSAEAIKIPKAPRRREQIKSPQFIRSLNLKEYKKFPLQRQFNFGKVNLIFGANASGKTSLLEGIELFFCGRNKRNPESSDPYELGITFVDGSTETADSRRNLQIFRDQNLKWYGQFEIRTNNLYLSFAQYNFLNTDAAVSLSNDQDSGPRLEEDLSKLLVGPDAAETWRNIERVNEAVVHRAKDFRNNKDELEEELNSVGDQIRKISEVKQESDSIRTHLDEMLHRMGWVSPQGDKLVFASSLMGSLSELISLVQQAIDLNLSNLPLSIDGLEKHFTELKVNVEEAEPAIAQLEIMEENQIRLKDAIEHERKALDLVKQAKHLIGIGIPKRIEQLNKEESTIATYSNYLAGLSDDFLRILSTENIVSSVIEYQQVTTSRLSESEALLVNTESEYANFSSLREESINLARELRQIAGKILQSSTNSDECPLCHTQFEPSKLEAHIYMEVNDQYEEIGKTLLQRLRELEEEVRNLITLKAASSWLNDFCGYIKLSTDTPVHLSITEVEKAKREFVNAQNRLEFLNSELFTLDTQGLSMTKLEDCYTQLVEFDYLLEEFTLESADQLILTIEQKLPISLKTFDIERKKVDVLKHELATTLGLVDPKIEALHAKLWQLKERLIEIEHLNDNLGAFYESFPWPKERRLGEILIEAESIRKVAADLQSDLNREEQAQLFNSQSSERKVHLEQQLNQLRPKLERLTNAQSVLDNIIQKYSLKGAMESAIQENRSGIENIFLRIHSPAEFSGLGSSLTTLIRKVDESEVNLNMISAGQRSAFALSIFLAQNSRQTTAPPMILIDDPIVYFDDLNALSFLDYLREIAVSGGRQIFFTTANEKLASLFERKFDFLGNEDFCRINLARDAFPTVSSEGVDRQR